MVTHLAQVAAAADTQVSVSKTVRDGATFATADRLDGDARVDEIARMLSGSTSGSPILTILKRSPGWALVPRT